MGGLSAVDPKNSQLLGAFRGRSGDYETGDHVDAVAQSGFRNIAHSTWDIGQ